MRNLKWNSPRTNLNWIQTWVMLVETNKIARQQLVITLWVWHVVEWLGNKIIFYIFYIFLFYIFYMFILYILIIYLLKQYINQSQTRTRDICDCRGQEMLLPVGYYTSVWSSSKQFQKQKWDSSVVRLNGFCEFV